MRSGWEWGKAAGGQGAWHNLEAGHGTMQREERNAEGRAMAVVALMTAQHPHQMQSKCQ